MAEYDNIIPAAMATIKISITGNDTHIDNETSTETGNDNDTHI